MQKSENNNSRNFIIGIVAVLAIVLLMNNFNKMSGAVTYSPDAIRYGNCVLNEDCNLKTGDVTYLNSVKIVIGTIGARGDIKIGVDEKVITIAKGEEVSIKGLKITNKVVYYDWKNSKNNYVVLLVSKEGGLLNEVTYEGVLDMLRGCSYEQVDLNEYPISCKEKCSKNGNVALDSFVFGRYRMKENNVLSESYSLYFVNTFGLTEKEWSDIGDVIMELVEENLNGVSNSGDISLVCQCCSPP